MATNTAETEAPELTATPSFVSEPLVMVAFQPPAVHEPTVMLLPVVGTKATVPPHAPPAVVFACEAPRVVE